MVSLIRTHVEYMSNYDYIRPNRAPYYVHDERFKVFVGSWLVLIRVPQVMFLSFSPLLLPNKFRFHVGSFC